MHDYLGSTRTVVLALSVAAIQLLALISYFVGFSATMAEATNIPSPAWAAGIFIICFYFLRKEVPVDNGPFSLEVEFSS